VAAGQFDVALRILNEQIGLINGAVLKTTVAQIFRSRAALLPLNGGLPPVRSFLERPSENSRDALPRISVTLAAQIERLSAAYKSFTAGAFTEALEHFRSILHALPLVVASSRAEASEIKEMVTICREYIIGVATELKRKDLVAQSADANAMRALELAALFTHVQLQPKHQQLVLKLAMNAAAKARNYATAEDFARRLLDSSPPQDVQDICDKVLRLCESKGGQDALKLNYDARNPFVICAGTLQPIYKGSASVACPYCAASFIPNAKGRRCTVCQLSEIGRASSSGLQSIANANRR
jgi:coatomer protein complex subunit alpha (xenin)